MAAEVLPEEGDGGLGFCPEDPEMTRDPSEVTPASLLPLVLYVSLTSHWSSSNPEAPGGQADTATADFARRPQSRVLMLHIERCPR